MALQWFVFSLIVTVTVVLLAAFLNRFYRKSTREFALIRTGLGGKKVIIDGGCLALPFLHRVEAINMRTDRLEVRRFDDKSLMTADRLRVNVCMEFYLRVTPTGDGIAKAAQALGAKLFRPENLKAMFEGKFIDAMQTAAASYTMDEIHEKRGEYIAAVTALLKNNLTGNGLELESVSLTDFDQTTFSALDENNAFNAVGMRRLAEIISVNKQQRVTIEANSDLVVRHTQLDAMKRKLQIEKDQEEARLIQQLEIATLRASTEARQKEAQIKAQLDEERCRIEKTLQVKTVEIDNEQSLRQREIESLLDVEQRKVDSQVILAEKRLSEIAIQIKTEQAKIEIVRSQETTQTERETAAAERGRNLAIIKAKQNAETLAIQADGETREKLARAGAELDMEKLIAEGVRVRMFAEAEGRLAMAGAENAESDEVRRARLEKHKLDTLPILAERMTKPLEKIDSIRINQISGLGGGGSGAQQPINSVLDGLLNFALQLPAMQKLGESVGVNIDTALEDAKNIGKNLASSKKEQDQ